MRVWPGDLLQLARVRPELNIDADREYDSWHVNMPPWQLGQLGQQQAAA